MDEIWNEKLPIHERVLSAITDDNSQIVLGGTHRTMEAIFNFDMVVEKSVSMAKTDYASLVRMVRFSEPFSAEWQTVAQTQLFAHFFVDIPKIYEYHGNFGGIPGEDFD